MNLRTILKKRREALKLVSPKQRDRARLAYQIALKAAQLKRECAA